MQRIHVLLVDDEMELLLVAALILKMQGYLVTTTTDPLEAFEILIHREPGYPTVDLLVTDLTMPVMGGVELIMRARAEGVDVPVLLMSGDRGKHVDIDCLRPGIDEYLDKPFPMPVLRERLELLAERVRRLRAER